MIYNMDWAKPNVTKAVLECYTIWIERNPTLPRLFWNVIHYELSETKRYQGCLEGYTIWIEQDQTLLRLFWNVIQYGMSETKRYQGCFGMLYNMNWAKPNVTKAVLECYTIWIERNQTLPRLYWNVIQYGFCKTKRYQGCFGMFYNMDLAKTKRYHSYFECYLLWSDQIKRYQGCFGMVETKC